MTTRSGRIQRGQKNGYFFIYLFILLFIESKYNTKRPGFGLGFWQALGLAIIYWNEEWNELSIE